MKPLFASCKILELDAIAPSRGHELKPKAGHTITQPDSDCPLAGA